MAIDTTNSYKSVGSATNRTGSQPLSSERKSVSDAPRQESTQSEDTVALSPQAQQLQRLQDKIDAAPAVDSERVAQIRQAISEGRFEINAERLAEAMLAQEDLLN